MPAKPRAFQEWPEALPTTYGPFRAVCDRVYDGDSALMVFDLSCDTYVPIPVRVFGVNSPESWQPGGDEATEYLRKLLPRDEPVLIRSHAWSFSRLVGSILLSDGRDVASEMVKSGHAKWADY